VFSLSYDLSGLAFYLFSRYNKGFSILLRVIL
jgi:hypothetical protein